MQLSLAILMHSGCLVLRKTSSVASALPTGSVAAVPFSELCGRPVAAADYLALAERFHTLLLSGVPAFGPAVRSEAYRFVTLIDVLYEHRRAALG